FTTRGGEATEIATELLNRGATRLAVLGGDGTLNEVVNGCFSTAGKTIVDQPTLALIPAGTGGDFARTLNLHSSAHWSAELLRTGKPKPCDVGAIEYSDGSVRYFI